MSQTSPKAIAVRKRLLEDYRFYTKHCLKVRTKDGQILPLVLNEAQEDLAEIIDYQLRTTGKIRIIILKARQLGLSTAVGAYIYHRVSQRKAQKALVVTHHGDSTRALFDMTQRYHDHVPEAVKPHTKYSSRKELVFDKLDSSYMVATAGGVSIARGETITYAHLSELAFWPKGSARENLNGILKAVPNEPGTAVFIESTANGVSGAFYEIWQGAVKGENGFYPLFIPWYVDDGYREPVPEGFERTPEEEKLVEELGLDNEQLVWRRREIATSGIDLFKQEYPSTPDEAFLTTGHPVFDPEILRDLKDKAPGILHRESILQLSETKYDWIPSPAGQLLVYKEMDPGETYYIGADVAMGIRSSEKEERDNTKKKAKDADYSVAQILDSKKRQVAVWRGRIHPREYARVLYELGMRYNCAKIAVEVNNHGLLTADILWKELHYPNCYFHIIEDKMDDWDTEELGFKTTAKSKPMIINELRSALKDGEIEVNDLVTIQELQTYTVTESGKLEAEQGCYDDCVMSLAICNHIHDGVFELIKNQQSWYIENGAF